MKYWMILLVAALTACTTSTTRAPVEERNPNLSQSTDKTSAKTSSTNASPATGLVYKVKKGDTLLSIARAHSLDYRDIALWNNLDETSRISIDQLLRLSPPNGEQAAATKRVPAPAPVRESKIEELSGGNNTEKFKRAPKGGVVAYSEEAMAQMKNATAVSGSNEPPARPAEPTPQPNVTTTPTTSSTPVLSAENVDWMWPTPAKLETRYVQSRPGKESNKGIDFSGKLGDPVYAAAAGKVVYAGSSLRGYGQLLIIRHNSTFLSAYAHNNKLLVKEGSTVSKGQKIAEFGKTDSDTVKLHFEIRKNGKPIDPEDYLPKR